MTGDNLVTTGAGTRAKAAEKASRAWRLRVAGADWAMIAREVGYANSSNAYRAVQRFFGQVPDVDREMLRGVARARGEALWLRAFTEVERSKGAPAAVRAAVAVLERHARLDGLDAPSQVEVRSPESEQFQAFVDAAARGMGLALPAEADIFATEYVDADVVADDTAL
jgi:AraC-like DNA-binding protein